MLGDFNSPNYGWFNNIPSTNSCYYNKITVNFIYPASWFLGLNKRKDSEPDVFQQTSRT